MQPLGRYILYFAGRDDDAETGRAVQDLLNLVSSFPDHFDETSMFNGGKHANVSGQWKKVVKGNLIHPLSILYENSFDFQSPPFQVNLINFNT